MPVYAALTSGDPPQYEFAQMNNNKYPKLAGGVKVFKFADMALLTEAKALACRERGFGLYRVTRKDTTDGSIRQAPSCETIDQFKEGLDITSWCEKCGLFTYGVDMRRKCWKCRQPTR